MFVAAIMVVCLCNLLKFMDLLMCFQQACAFHVGPAKDPVMIFAWSPIWGMPGQTDNFKVVLNKIPIAVIPRRILAQFLDGLLEIIVEVPEP